MSDSYFSFKKFTIYQEKAAMKITTDACILGSYARSTRPKKILDIGIGTGILSIMLAQRYKSAEVVGIESDQSSANQAQLNSDTCPWCDRIKINHIRIQDFVKEIPGKFDLIICNPPYYEYQLKSPFLRKNLARHAIDLPFSSLAYAINKLLKEEGNFYTITPYESFQRLSAELTLLGIGLFDYLEIFNTPEKPLCRIIGGFSKTQRKKIEKKLFIKNENKEYSTFFKYLLKDFYLAF